MSLSAPLDLGGGDSNVSPIALISKVCDLYDISEDDLCSKRRTRVISHARWALSYVLVEDWGWSYMRIGKQLKKDHAAIMYGYGKAVELLRTNETFFQSVQELRNG